MLELLIGAAALGIIIAVMEQGEFPGWGKMLICVLAAVVPAAILHAVLPTPLFFIGWAVGAMCATVAISATCSMSVMRAGIAAEIYLAFQMVVSLAIRAMLRS